MNLKEINDKLHHRIADMSIAGQFKKGILFEVLVYSKDGGNEPHIHVVDENTDGDEFNACIKLTSPEYFPHGGKYTDTLNSRQKRAFVNFINSIDPDSKDLGKERTVYEVCCWLWNKNNSNLKVKVQYDENNNPIIPDYSQL